MNVLWLVFGGILTAVEYMIASLLMMITIVGIPFGMQTMKMAGLALWPFGKEVRRAFGRLSVHTDECIVDFSGRNMDLPFAFGVRRIAVYHRHRYSFRDAAFQTCRFGVGTFRKRYCGIITSYYPV